jgi:hypothetical protein
LILLLFTRNVWAVLRKICQTENKPLEYTFRCTIWYKILWNLRPEGIRGVEWQYCSFMECDVLQSGTRWFKYSDDGGGNFLRSFSQLLLEFKALQRRRQ